MGPGLAGMDICTWKRRRAASVASTFSLTGVCACSGRETSARRATAEIRIPSILATPEDGNPGTGATSRIGADVIRAPSVKRGVAEPASAAGPRQPLSYARGSDDVSPTLELSRLAGTWASCRTPLQCASRPTGEAVY